MEQHNVVRIIYRYVTRMRRGIIIILHHRCLPLPEVPPRSNRYVPDYRDIIYRFATIAFLKRLFNLLFLFEHFYFAHSLSKTEIVSGTMVLHPSWHSILMLRICPPVRRCGPCWVHLAYLPSIIKL